LAYLPLALSRAGTPLEVEIFGEKVPAQVAQRILYDPNGEILKK
jgi:glycine cleavage system aminomethyltransferase T